MEPTSKAGEVLAGPNSVDGLVCRVVDDGAGMAVTEELRNGSWVPSEETIRDVLRGTPVRPEDVPTASPSAKTTNS